MHYSRCTIYWTLKKSNIVKLFFTLQTTARCLIFIIFETSIPKNGVSKSFNDRSLHFGLFDPSQKFSGRFKTGILLLRCSWVRKLFLVFLVGKIQEKWLKIGLGTVFVIHVGLVYRIIGYNMSQALNFPQLPSHLVSKFFLFFCFCINKKSFLRFF